MKVKQIIPLLILCMLIVMLPTKVSASEDIIASGLHDHGPIKWELTSDGTLTITGSRTMQTTTYGWANYSDMVKKIVFEGGIKSIGERAFADMVNLEEVDLGDAMESIHLEAFMGCTSLRSVSFPATMELIDHYAFYNCPKLAKITFSPKTESLVIGSYAFYGSAVKELTFPGGVKEIDKGAFSDSSKLKTLNLSEGIERIGNGAFKNCPSLTGHLYIPATLEEFYGNFADNDWTSAEIHSDNTNGAFQENTSLKKVTFGGNATLTGYRAFDGCTGLKTVIFNSAITEISANSFVGCTSLTSIELPETITTISTRAFEGSGLKQIIIPAAVTEIGDSAFYDCPLKEIYFLGKAPSFGVTIFKDVIATAYYPEDDSSWTKKVRKNYGGELTWVPYSPVAPEIVEQPTNTYTKAGKTAYVSLTAKGMGLKYQWYVKNAGAKKYSKSSVTSATYTCKMNEKSKDRLVYCVITDYNGATVKSKTVILREAASITSQPQDAQAQSGKTVKVRVTASGDNLKYQWYIKNAGAKKYSKSSVTSPTYSCKMSDKAQGRQVYCVVTDAYGKTSKSKTATLGMAVSITQQPESVTVEAGETAMVSFQAIGDDLTYTWYFADIDDASFKKTSTFKDNIYSVKMSEARDGRQVYCVITDAYGNKVTTDVVSLNMK